MSNGRDKITFDVISLTEDTSDAVIKVELGESQLTFIKDDKAESINVWYVYSEREGDMSIMLDVVVERTGYNWIQFIAPFDDEEKTAANALYSELGFGDDTKFNTEEDDSNIKDKLNGFQKVTNEYDGKEIPMLVGFWNTD